MPNLLRLVSDLVCVFDRLELRYALGGALATNYWGVVRTTQDVDCLIALPALKYQGLADELQAIGCKLRDAKGNTIDVDARLMREQANQRQFIECFRDSVRIELFVPVVPLQDEVLRRAVKMPLGNAVVSVTTPEDLVLLKLAFHRAKDVQDVRGILWVQRGNLDLDYLWHWSAVTLDEDAQQELRGLIQQHATEDHDQSHDGGRNSEPGISQ